VVLSRHWNRFYYCRDSRLAVIRSRLKCSRCLANLQTCLVSKCLQDNWHLCTSFTGEKADLQRWLTEKRDKQTSTSKTLWTAKKKHKSFCVDTNSYTCWRARGTKQEDTGNIKCTSTASKYHDEQPDIWEKATFLNMH
jgi:hypothetical protein